MFTCKTSITVINGMVQLIINYCNFPSKLYSDKCFTLSHFTCSNYNYASSTSPARCNSTSSSVVQVQQ